MRGRGVVGRSVVRVEPVPDAGVDDDLDVRVVLLQELAEPLGVLGLRVLVRLAVEAEKRDLDVLGEIESRDRPRRALIGSRGRPVPGDRALHVGVGRRDLVHGRSAPAPAGDADAGRLDVGPRLGPVDRRLAVAQRLLALLREHDLEDVLDVGQVRHAALALEQLGRDRVVARLGEPPGAVADVLVDAPDLGEHQHDRVVFPRRRPGLVDRHLVAADLDHLVAGDDPLGVGLDRLGEHLVDGERVARRTWCVVVSIWRRVSIVSPPWSW